MTINGEKVVISTREARTLRGARTRKDKQAKETA